MARVGSASWTNRHILKTSVLSRDCVWRHNTTHWKVCRTSEFRIWWSKTTSFFSVDDPEHWKIYFQLQLLFDSILYVLHIRLEMCGGKPFKMTRLYLVLLTGVGRRVGASMELTSVSWKYAMSMSMQTLWTVYAWSTCLHCFLLCITHKNIKCISKHLYRFFFIKIFITTNIILGCINLT